MKTKIMLILTLALTGAMWLTTHPLTAADAIPTSQKVLYYTCTMHPSVKMDKPGDCPICGMHLVPVYETSQGTNAPPIASGANVPMMMTGCYGASCSVKMTK